MNRSTKPTRRSNSSVRGRGRGRNRSNRSKSAHKARRSGTQLKVKQEYPDQIVSSSTVVSRGTFGGRGRGRGRGKSRNRNVHGRGRSLKPISVAKNSIHSQWKQQIGGLIRYYVNDRINSKNETVSQQDAEREVEGMYYRASCSIEETKCSILAALGVTKDLQKDFVEINMILDSDSIENVESYERSMDGKGLILPKIDRPGEGPAHAHEIWTNVVIPNAAVGKSFYFQVKNNTPINLSCEIALDENIVARNAPLPSSQTRTIKPDNKRYFEAHKWVLQEAKKVSLSSLNVVKLEEDDQVNVPQEASNERKNTPRYNGIRPNYNDERVNIELYPDPSYFGWTFTGSVEESKVEFFEKRTNIGLTKMDWYYTTGTIKTILDHPTTGRNALFRGTVSPEQFVSICKNPRAHTTRGYRRRVDRPIESSDLVINVDTDMQMKDVDEFDQEPEVPMNDGNGTGTYYAKNDNYNFSTQGHANRRNEMEKLHQNYQFTQWERASKKEWAVVHAKFYISLPQRTRRGLQNRPDGHTRSRELEALPEQASVVNVKSAENATLGTKFMSTGLSNQNTRRSTVRMNRIHGINDDGQWKGGPLFEKKLFYRSEDVVSNQGPNNDDDDSMDMDKQSANDNDVDLTDYKNEKLSQVRQYNIESELFNPDNAARLLHECCSAIEACQNAEDIDTIVQTYYSEIVKYEFNRNA